MSNPIAVSVILPVYGVEKFLAVCLDTIIEQTLTNIEIICVNDCSPDNCQIILEEYAERDDRFVLYEQKVNQGQGAARNTGVALAKGEYIYFLDPDDAIFDERSLELLYGYAKKDDSVMVIGNAHSFPYNGSPDGPTSKMYFASILGETRRNITIQDEPELLKVNSVWNRLIKRSFLMGKDIKHLPPRHAEDVIFALHSTYHADSITLVSQPTMKYRLGRFFGAATKQKCWDALTNQINKFNFIKKHEGEGVLLEHCKFLFLEYICDTYRRDIAAGMTREERIQNIRNASVVLDEISQSIIDLLPKWRKQYVGLIKKGEYDQALSFLVDNAPYYPKEAECKGILADSKGERAPWTNACSPALAGANEHQRIAIETRMNGLLRQKIDAVHNSLSWRLTAPLRFAYRVFFGGKAS